MSGLNKVMLIGRLGKDPETRTFENGGSICTFSVATSETYKDKTTGEKKETTEWHNIVMQNELGKVAQKYLFKGSQVYLEGKMRTRQYEAKDGGGTRYVTEVLALSMTLLGSKQDAQKPQADAYDVYAPSSNPVPKETPKPASTGASFVPSDDLPF